MDSCTPAPKKVRNCHHESNTPIITHAPTNSFVSHSGPTWLSSCLVSHFACIYLPSIDFWSYSLYDSCCLCQFPTRGWAQIYAVLLQWTIFIVRPRQWPGRFLGVIGCDPSVCKSNQLHSKLRSITPVATKVHVILRSFVVLTWMRGVVESV